MTQYSFYWQFNGACRHFTVGAIKILRTNGRNYDSSRKYKYVNLFRNVNNKDIEACLFYSYNKTKEMH